MKTAQHSRIGELTLRKVLAAQTPPTALAPDRPLAAALGALAVTPTGALLVVAEGQAVGTLIAVDLLRHLVAAGGPVADIPVRTVTGPLPPVFVPGCRVRDCLADLAARGTGLALVVEPGASPALLTREMLLQAMVAHQDGIFAAQELDQRILFLQGTYSC